MVNTHHYRTLQEAWEGLNEELAINTPEVIEKGGTVYGAQAYYYSVFAKIDKALVDPDFDLGIKIGYTTKKWSSLINNYLDYEGMEFLKQQVQSRVEKKSKAYSYRMMFSNTHDTGKDCLTSLTILKRQNQEKPIAIFHVRATEVTKRLIFDFLLVQRIIEYVYGHNDIEVHYYVPVAFITCEGFAMYDNHKSVSKLLKKKYKSKEDLPKFPRRVFDTIKYLKTTHAPSIKYKVNRRSAMQLQWDEHGNPLSGKPSLKVSQLKIKS